jgi:SAM-dependent methyltransferase
MHQQQSDFIRKVLDKYPKYKTEQTILDCGSLDINGNNRKFFDNYKSYTGLDVGPGNNVDIISRVHEYKTKKKYSVVISGEMLEHDEYWEQSLQRMINLTKSGGIIILTCATEGRPEHGTTRTSPQDAPYIGDYYKNLTETDFRSVIDTELFLDFAFDVNTEHCDLYFYGIKK